MGERSVLLRADDVLRRFFAVQVQAQTARRIERLRRAEADLRGCLDEMVPVLLERHERALLALERQFDPVDAAARVADAEAVLLLLPTFLDEPRWHGRDVADRTLRIRLAQALAEEIVHDAGSSGVDVGRAAWVVEASVRHEIWMLRQERAASRRR